MKVDLASKYAFSRVDLLNSVIEYGFIVSHTDEYYSPICTKTQNMRNQLFALIINSTHVYECTVVNASRLCGNRQSISQIFLIQDKRNPLPLYVICDPSKVQTKYPYISQNPNSFSDNIDKMLIFSEEEKENPYNVFTADIARKDLVGAKGAFQRYKALNGFSFGNYAQYCYNTGKNFNYYWSQNYESLYKIFVFPFQHSTYSDNLIKDAKILLQPFETKRNEITEFLRAEFSNFNIVFGLAGEIEFYEYASYLIANILQIHLRSTSLYKRYKFIPVYGALKIVINGEERIIPHHFAIMKISFTQENKTNILQCAIDFFGNEFVSSILNYEGANPKLLYPSYGPYDTLLNEEKHCRIAPVSQNHDLRFDKYQDLVTKFYQQFIFSKEGQDK